MKLAYLMNMYPLISTTFIRREIEAHERAGVPVDRFAIRPWDQDLVDPKDIAEVPKMEYLLAGGLGGLARSALREIASNLPGFLRASRATAKMVRVAKGNRLKTIVYFLEAIVLKQKATARGVTHIHTHFSTNSAAVAMLSHLLGGPPYSVTIHGPDELYEMERNALALKVEHASFIAAITEYCRNVVDTHCVGRFTDKIRILRCGLDFRDFPEPGPVPETSEIVCVGRLCPAKAQSLLVEAMADVVKTHPDARLTLLGDGEDRPEIEATIVKHGLEKNVHLAGWATNDDVRAAVTRSRALVLPSKAEGLPIVIMESFALGRPVVSTIINGIPELVDESCGWLSPFGDIPALVENLKALLDTPPETLTTMATEGRRRVLEYHDQDRNAAQLRTEIEGSLRNHQ